MIIRIDTVSTTPIYVQLRNEIVKGIGRGELSEGECLPTVRQLAADLGVNSMTVSKAYQTLKAEGFIETDRRRGAIVRSGVQSGAQPDERFREKLEDELELLSAEAKIKGLGREEFIHLCSMAFAGMEGGEYDAVSHISVCRHLCNRNLLCRIREEAEVLGGHADGRASSGERGLW